MSCCSSIEGEPLIPFPPGSLPAVFLRREKRFLVEVRAGCETFWVHTNNSGSMMGLLKVGAEVLISPAERAGRRLAFTLELVRVQGFWVGVNTLVPNRLLRAAWQAGLMPETAGYDTFKSEAKYGRSRIDGFFNGPSGPLWVENKNVTLVEDGVAYFPDAVTIRGQKHLQELMALARQGQRTACFYVIQRPDADCFAPADFIDPAFTDLFLQAQEAGVETWPYQALASPQGIRLGNRLPMRWF
ncbi:DNA/RNA nuclease SfsA [Desulforhabdus sp. TSK]|uniref:DNA/RNA nuclease SfsA n=1 Tax=Desulforhabdus sp. TSK TaxID=2925014 RepID=UPI001FC7C4C4|nr:DNA/RNA nuclease SfsA [Desulforhabdus sp. TSK]GKT07493.1 sugar fermentation stimulation protein [Desulforhabdus sp. TSK]